MKRVLYAICVFLIVSSCGSTKPDITLFAKDMCECFSSTQAKMDAEDITLFEKVKNSATPQQTLQQEMAKLTPEKLREVTDLILSISSKDSEISKCLSNFDKTHENIKSTDRLKLALEIATKMKEDKNCVLGSAVIYMGAKTAK